MKRERLSNIEALRLLCMLMVLNLHSFYGDSHGGGIFQAIDFFRESTSICAVDCFVLISGYFGIKWKIKSFYNLVFQVIFYSIGVYLVAVLLGFISWDVKEFALRFACLFASSWGFVVSYIILYFSSPLLNLFAEKSTLRDLFIYIITIFIAINFISLPEHSFFTYALIYLIGRLLHRINVSELTFNAGRAYWTVTTLLFVFVYALLYKGLHITSFTTITKLPVGVIGYAYSSPLVILQAVFLFICFAKMKFHSKFVNWCASSSFAIFLIHMHPSIKEIGYYSFSRSLYNLPLLHHIIILISLIASVFFLSIFIDKFRIYISSLFYNGLYKISRFLTPKLFDLDYYMPKSFIQIISK